MKYTYSKVFFANYREGEGNIIGEVTPKGYRILHDKEYRYTLMAAKDVSKDICEVESLVDLKRVVELHGLYDTKTEVHAAAFLDKIGLQYVSVADIFKLIK